MAQIVVSDGALTVSMHGIDKILALRGHLSVRLEHVRGVEVRPEEARQIWHGLKFGTNLPGVVTAGTFFTGEGKLFYDLHDPERTIAIDLEGEDYRRLIVQVDDGETPEAVAQRIRAALAAGKQ